MELQSADTYEAERSESMFDPKHWRKNRTLLKKYVLLYVCHTKPFSVGAVQSCHSSELTTVKGKIKNRDMRRYVLLKDKKNRWWGKSLSMNFDLFPLPTYLSRMTPRNTGEIN